MVLATTLAKLSAFKLLFYQQNILIDGIFEVGESHKLLFFNVEMWTTAISSVCIAWGSQEWTRVSWSVLSNVLKEPSREQTILFERFWFAQHWNICTTLKNLHNIQFSISWSGPPSSRCKYWFIQYLLQKSDKSGRKSKCIGNSNLGEEIYKFRKKIPDRSFFFQC